jgi:hypothetical protein
MSLLTVIQDVCAAVGVERPDSVFSNIGGNRTMQEMLALANEMAQRIAYDGREWGALKKQATFTGDGVIVPPATIATGTEAFSLPADYKRMLLTSNVWRSTSTLYPMRFIADHDQWLQRRAWGYNDPRGEWILFGGQMHIAPIMGVTVTAKFPYLDKNCINLSIGGVGDSFTNDADSFRLDERMFKLGMIWQWKANKGTPYAEDLNTFNDALDRIAGADKPAPIIVGGRPISEAARTAYPFPIDPNMVPL